MESLRREYVPEVPPLLLSGEYCVREHPEGTASEADHEEIASLFSHLYGAPVVELIPTPGELGQLAQTPCPPLVVGCVLSGGQAAGGHNCICGLFDFLQERAPGSTLLGFTGGPRGVMTNSAKILDAHTINGYRNSGGFTMLGSGRDKIETAEQFEQAATTARSRHLDGLVVIGGDDSNTNAALLAEHFHAQGLPTRVVGLPKTIDGDLKNEWVESSFGFDTAAKLYAELLGNIMCDCESSRKYYHFVRLMGREASHLTLEVALRTQPTLAFIGEEVLARGLRLSDLANEIADAVEARDAAGLPYGVVLIPEGLVDFVPEMRNLICELNELLARREAMSDSNAYEGFVEGSIGDELSPDASSLFAYLPEFITQQLLLERDPHGNVQVAKIESERLLGSLVEAELASRPAVGSGVRRFAAQYHYLGYEGRCPPPSNFDANYCAALGRTAGSLIGAGVTGVMACLKGLSLPASHWRPLGVPLTAMMRMERRRGQRKSVIRKALVDTAACSRRGAPFQAFAAQRHEWKRRARFSQPGPLQLWGPLADSISLTLRHESGESDAPLVPNSPEDAPSLRCERRASPPSLPAAFESSALCLIAGETPTAAADDAFVAAALPHSYGRPRLELVAAEAHGDAPAGGAGSLAIRAAPGLTIGICFCGRQCPGAHNVIAGVARFLRERVPGSAARLLGFVGGTKGLFSGQAHQLDDEQVEAYLNSGGMQLLGRTSDVIRGPAHLAQVEATCRSLAIDGLVLVGGAVSNSDTALLAEHFVSQGVRTAVVGVPASIDGDLLGSRLEASLGFDTACRVYASIVGNLAADAASARKYWYFVRIMGRSPSHITLQVANLTNPNLALMGEEIETRRMSLAAIVSAIADGVEGRAKEGKHYGVVLIPEGLVEYIPEMNALLREIAAVQRAAHGGAAAGRAAGEPTEPKLTTRLGLEALSRQLTPWSAALLASMPPFIRRQLQLESQASDHKAQLSQIETERLLADMVRYELQRRREAASLTAEWCAPDARFDPVCFYLGYQARSSMPSRFDCDLGNTLGFGAAALAAAGATAYMATAHCLVGPASRWRVCGTPLYSLLSAENRAGAAVPAIRPSRVDLRGACFARFSAARRENLMGDHFVNPGPLQFHGPLAMQSSPHLVGHVETRHEKLAELAAICRHVEATCWPGCDEDVLRTALAQLRALKESLAVLHDRNSERKTPAMPTHSRATQLTAEQIARRRVRGAEFDN